MWQKITSLWQDACEMERTIMDTWWLLRIHNHICTSCEHNACPLLARAREHSNHWHLMISMKNPWGLLTILPPRVVILRLRCMGLGCFRRCDHCQPWCSCLGGVLDKIGIGGDLPWSRLRIIWLPTATLVWSLALQLSQHHGIVPKLSILIAHANIFFGANNQSRHIRGTMLPNPLLEHRSP